jgi:hypothetical protein
MLCDFLCYFYYDYLYSVNDGAGKWFFFFVQRKHTVIVTLIYLKKKNFMGMLDGRMMYINFILLLPCYTYI